MRESSAPRGIRTPDLLVRSQTLYPTELEALIEDRSVRGPNLMLKLNILVVAERVGFEPTDRVSSHFLSREAHSTRLCHLSRTVNRHLLNFASPKIRSRTDLS